MIFTVFTTFEDKNSKKIKKKFEKIWRLKKVRIFAARLRENDVSHGTESSLKRLKESTRSKYREKYNLSRSVNFFGNYKCQEQAEKYKDLYNEEFDPGSG